MMRETDTSAPSLGAVPAVATEAMKRAGTELALRISLSSGYGWHEYMADLWATMLAAAPPTAMAEAVASARAEGVKEGLERAAEAAEYVETTMYPVLTKTRYQSHEVASYHKTSCALVRDKIRALIPAPPTLTPGGSSDV